MFGIHTSVLLTSLVLISHGATQQYEYVVVGSGPGGGPLAVDLARAGHSVLLLEAGSDLTDDPIYEYVRDFSAATNDPRSRWDFFVQHSDDPARDRQFEHFTWRTTNGSFYVGLDPPEGAEALGIWYPRAATLGGCAMHNAARLDLPSDDNWDHIADITGDASWSAEEMRGIFQDIENCHYAANGTEGHGFGGWLDSSREGDADWVGAAADGTALLRAVTRAVGGAPANATDADLGELVRRDNNDAMDPDRDQATGVFGLLSHMTPDGRRRAPAHYIRETLDAGHDRYPLTVELDALLTRVVFDTLVPSQPPAAMAVEYVVGASAYGADPRHDPTGGGGNTTRGFVYAMREVIIAGGAFNSPQILKLSGVGPAEELERHNITLVKDLPGVGTNLGDNYESSVVSLAAKPLDSFGGQYAVRLKTAASQGIRDIFMWVSNVAFEGHWPGFPNNYGPNQVAFGFTQTDPRRGSEGTVALRSGDPLEPPEINFRYFETGGGDEDLQALTEAVRFAHQAQGNVSADSGLAPFDEIRPCAGGRASNCTDASIKEFLRLQASSHHASGTCAIGADDDPMAVLDSRFRVRGVDRLRVVDASVFPKPPGAFPVLPTFMISRKAAKVILEDAL